MGIIDFFFQNIHLIVFFLTAGTIAGITAGLFGIGGGVVIVPILYHFSEQLGIPTEHKVQIITATSLFMISVNSLISAYMRSKYQEVDTKIFLKWLPSLVIGSICGVFLNIFAKSDFVIITFAAFCSFIAAKMFFNWRFPYLGKVIPKNRASGSALGFLIAGFSSLIGIGGGTLSVPTLNFFGLPLKIATGTSTLFSAIIACSAGTVYAVSGIIQNDNMPYSQIGYINWPALIFIIPASMSGAIIGAKISKNIQTTLLRKLFAIVLFLSAIKMIYNVM